MTARALLFDEDAARDVELDEAVADLGRSRLLWVELDRADTDGVRRAAETLRAEERAVRLLVEGAGHPVVADFQRQVAVSVLVPDDADGELIEVSAVVGEDWLLTVAPREAETVGEFRDRVTGSGEVGALDALSFLAALLEWAIEGYLRAFDSVEEELDRVDVALMRAADDVLDETLGSLVELRRRTGRLRRALSAHRRVLVALAHPELDAVSSEESAERFTSLVDRLDHAIGAAEAARDSVLGSFELIIARSGQRTNEIMKVLTLASVLLLPSSVLAGVMGMNFKVGLFEHPQLFWVVLGAMLLFAAGALAVARLRRWI